LKGLSPVSLLEQIEQFGTGGLVSEEDSSLFYESMSNFVLQLASQKQRVAECHDDVT
jgi:hypothetical protein